MPEPLRVSGQTVVDAYDEWIKTEIKGGPPQRAEFGKFSFSVSVGTLGAIAALEKLNTAVRMDLAMLCSIAALFVSMVLALSIAMPHVLTLSSETDLRVAHSNEINSIVRRMWFWFAVWCAGTILGGWAVSG